MNIFLQMGLGLSVSLIVVWIIIVKRKAWRLRPVLWTVVFTLICTGCVTLGVMKQSESAGETVKATAKEMLTYANALLCVGEYDEVMKTVQDYSAVYGYDDDCSYVVAKLKALQGNYTEARGIYDCLTANAGFYDEVEDEYDLVTEKAGADSSYIAMMDFLAANGKDPAEYGYTDAYVKSMERALKITDEDIAKAIREHIEDTYNVDEYEDSFEMVSDIRSLYEKCLDSGSYALSEEENDVVKKFFRKYDDLKEEYPAAAASSMMQEAKLKAALLQGDYKDLVNRVGKNSGYKELLIASELYMNGTVKEKDFAEDYVKNYGALFDKVADKLDKILDKLGNKLTKPEKNELKATVETLEKAEKDPVLYVMREQLNGQAALESKAASEIELGISKIEYFYENEERASDHFYDAVITGRDSENKEYSEVMEKIEAIVTDSDPSEIVNLNDYVEQAVVSAMPENSYHIIAASKVVDPGAADEETKPAYTEAMTDYVSEIKSSIAIGQIDASGFDTVKASVTIASKYAENSKELKQMLKIYDCGLEITDFEIEKIEFDSLKTMLVCDVSGSMSGCLGDLQAAVVNYVNNMHEDEAVSIVMFSDKIDDTKGFTEDQESLKQFANAMHICGGTQIYNTLYSCLNSFDAEITSNDTIILMTDGQDGGGRDTATIMQEIGGLAREKGITIYTIGLGSVDAGYLSTLASAGNGSMVYVSDSESLTAFYELLQSQVDNQYMITYKAKDTLLAKNRSLEVRIESENIYDLKEYSLYADEENTDADSGEEDIPAGTLSVVGLDIRSAQKSKKDIVAHLIGTGFSEKATARMKLLGDVDYDIDMEYVDEGRYKVIIPAKISVGTYDLEITINDKKAYIENGFCLYEAGETKVTKFGPYTFTSMGKSVSGEETVLYGNVTMNGWLTFNGELVLNGNLQEDSGISVTDKSGSYVSFDKTTATGIGAYFAEKGISFSVPKLGSFHLYNDPAHIYDYDNYHVDSIRTTSLKIFQVVFLEAPAIKLYPDSIKLEYSQGTTILPFQKDIFKAVGVEMPFSFDLASEAVLNGQNVGINIDFQGKDERNVFKQFNVMNAPVELDMNALKIKIDTMEHKYTFGGMVKIKFRDMGLGAEVSLNGFQIDSVLLTVDKDVSVMLGQVPLTFSKFRLGAEDIATAVANKRFGNVNFIGQLDLAVAKVGAYFPKLKAFIGDLSLLSLEDATIEFRWNPFKISTSSELKIFEEFSIAKTNFHMGNYPYSNALLGLENRDVQGFNVSLTEGFMWDIDNCHVNLSGTSELSGNSRFIGVEYKGEAELIIDWWTFVSSKFEKSGEVLVGIYFTEAGEPQFTVAFAYQNMWGTNKKLYFYIDKNGNINKENNRM